MGGRGLTTPREKWILCYGSQPRLLSPLSCVRFRIFRTYCWEERRLIVRICLVVVCIKYTGIDEDRNAPPVIPDQPLVVGGARRARRRGRQRIQQEEEGKGHIRCP